MIEQIAAAAAAAAVIFVPASFRVSSFDLVVVYLDQ